MLPLLFSPTNAKSNIFFFPPIFAPLRWLPVRFGAVFVLNFHYWHINLSTVWLHLIFPTFLKPYILPRTLRATDELLLLVPVSEPKLTGDQCFPPMFSSSSAKALERSLPPHVLLSPQSCILWLSALPERWHSSFPALLYSYCVFFNLLIMQPIGWLLLFLNMLHT